MQDAIMLDQEELVAEFERKVRDKKVFFEVINLANLSPRV